MNSMEIEEPRVGEQAVIPAVAPKALSQRVGALFNGLDVAKNAQSYFLTHRKQQDLLLDDLKKHTSGSLIEKSNVGLDREKHFLTGRKEIMRCCQEIKPIVEAINEATEELYGQTKLSCFQDAEDRQAMRIGGSFFDTLLRRLEALNERLIAPKVLESDHDDLMRRQLKLRVVRSRKDLLIVHKDLQKFFKIIAGEPCDIGDSEPVDMRLLAKHMAHKFDVGSVPELVEWAPILCKWYNKLFTKDGEQPLQLPEWLQPSVNHKQSPRDLSQGVDADVSVEGEQAVTPLVVPQQGDLAEVSDEQLSHIPVTQQSSLLPYVARVEEVNGDLKGAGGKNGQLKHLKNCIDGNGGVVFGALKKIKAAFDNVFKPAPKSGLFKRFVFFVARRVSKKVGRFARWIAYKTFLNKQDFERKPWKETKAGQFWNSVLPGRYKKQQLEPEAPRRWYHRFIFWKRKPQNDPSQIV